jgi:hypothetical protein
MDLENATRELRVIRQLMERPVRYSVTSGASAILAGACALVGLALDWWVWCTYDSITTMWINLAVWGGVFAAAFAGVVVLTRIRERKQGMPFWSPVKTRILLTIAPPFVVGVGLTAAIIFRWYYGIGPNEWGLIPSIWMACYGLALWQVGDFSVAEVRLLGVAFILAALGTAGYWQYSPYWTLGVSFGGFHIAYGAIVAARHGG